MPFDGRRFGLKSDFNGGVVVVDPSFDDVTDAVNPSRETLSFATIDKRQHLIEQFFVALEVVEMFVDPMTHDVEDPQLHRLHVLFTESLR